MDKTKTATAILAACITVTPIFGYTATNDLNNNELTTAQELILPFSKMNRELQYIIDADLESTVNMANRAIPSTRTIAKQGSAETTERTENSLSVLIDKILRALDWPEVI